MPSIEKQIEKEILANEIKHIVRLLNEKIDTANNLLFLDVTINQNGKMGSKNSHVNCFVSETIGF